MILLMESDLTLWKDRDFMCSYRPELLPLGTVIGFYVGSSPTGHAILRRERKRVKAVTAIGAVECGTKPGSTKPTWKNKPHLENYRSLK